MELIHQKSEWPEFTWNYDAFAGQLAEVRYHQGLLLGGMKNLGFDLRSEAALNTLSSDVIASSAPVGHGWRAGVAPRGGGSGARRARRR